MSPSTSARRNACSEAVARAISSFSAARRAATEPAPLIAATAASAASTSATVSVGVSRGRGRVVAQRRPADPEHALARRAGEVARARHALLGASPRSAAASRSTFASRPETPRTSSVAAASSANSTRVVSRFMNVLVTGASTGIGRATALLLAERGMTVYAGMRNPADGEALGPPSARSSSTSRTPTTSRPLRDLELDGLVNNAGIAVSSPLEFLPLDELRRQLEVNTIAQLAVIQACLPALRRARGRIVNLSSISGLVVLPLYGPYAASKFAFEALSDALRRELRGSVHVSIVEPGAIATPIWERGSATADALFAAMPPDAHERYGELVATMRAEAAKQPVEGLPPEVVANVIATALTASARARAT